MSQKRYAQIVEMMDTLDQLGVEMKFKVSHYISLFFECVNYGQYALSARILRTLPADAAARAIRALCESR